jgi:hypothetical protein
MPINLCHKRKCSLGIHWGFTGDSLGIHWGFIGETLHICSIMHNIHILLHISNILRVLSSDGYLHPVKILIVSSSLEVKKGKSLPKLEKYQYIAIR